MADILSWSVIAFYLLLQASYFGLLTLSIIGVWRQPKRAKLLVPEVFLDSTTTPPVTLLVPAYNEQATAVESVRALLGLQYPRLEVIVINDGSTDGTLDELIRSFSLHPGDIVYNPILASQPVRDVYLSALDPRLMVIDKVNGGKSDSLNAGINLCRTPWICSVDADSILEEDALIRVMRPVIEDDWVVASSGIVRIANGCRVAAGRVTRVVLPADKLACYEVIEYLRGFLQGRLAWSWVNGLLIISGAFGVFRTDVMRSIGGYSRATVAEDMEVVVRIHRYFRERGEAYRVVFVPDPVCWTEVPITVGALRRQRRRWHRGLAEVLSIHRNLFLKPGMGLLGSVVLPLFAVELVAPVVEVAGYVFIPAAWAMGWISSELLFLYLALAFMVGISYAVFAVLLEEFTYRRYASAKDLVRLLSFALTEHLGYHQLIVWSSLEGLVDHIRKRRGWGVQIRRGFSARPS